MVRFTLIKNSLNHHFIENKVANENTKTKDDDFVLLIQHTKRVFQNNMFRRM